MLPARPHSTIRVFRAAPMEWTYFEAPDPPEEFKRIGVQYVDTPEVADIIIADTVSALRKFGAWRKRFAIWTGEPRYDLHRLPLVNVRRISRPVHVMNVHTGRLYKDNYLFLGPHAEFDVDRDRILRVFASKPRRAVMLATFRRKRSKLRWFFRSLSRWQNPRTSLVTTAGGGLLLDGRDIGLYQRRQELALELQQQGFCDVYGRGWPEDVQTNGESRAGAWIAAKRGVLENYGINIAFENTTVPHYVTEKIWDAIAAGCLPVYHGTENRIYDDFPPGSFIEAGGKTRDTLAREIMAIGRQEASDRFELCLDTYLRIVREGRPQISDAACRERTAEFLEDVMDGKPPTAQPPPPSV